MERWVLEHRSGAQAVIYRHGAHVASWTPAGESDVFFVSRKSPFAPGKGIRGGIPVIFPQFGEGTLPRHGFARILEWTVDDAQVLPGGDASVRMILKDSVETRALWPFRFALELTALLGEQLTVTLRVSNPDPSPFRFQTALHSYFAVADIRRTLVRGLKGTTLSDSLRANQTSVEDRAAIEFDAEVDRRYREVPDEVRLVDAAGRRDIVIAKRNMPDVVLWNPWVEESRRRADLADDDYLRMICVETGCIHTPIELKPHQSWDGSTTLAVRRARA